MKLELTAVGDALRYLEANAQALGIDDEDQVAPDPVELFSQFVDKGFADRGDDGRSAPRLVIESSHFDPAALKQTWLLDVVELDAGFWRVLSNLLFARGVGSLSTRVVEAGTGATPTSFGLAEAPFPQTLPPREVHLDYTPPDEDDIVRSRTLHLELAAQPEQTLVTRICDDLNVWIEVVCRSGFCPEDEEPENAGAIPAFAYALDPQTIAVEFEGAFRVDEACFASIASYVWRLHSEGVRAASIEVA